MKMRPVLNHAVTENPAVAYKQERVLLRISSRYQGKTRRKVRCITSNGDQTSEPSSWRRRHSLEAKEKISTSTFRVCTYTQMMHGKEDKTVWHGMWRFSFSFILFTRCCCCCFRDCLFWSRGNSSMNQRLLLLQPPFSVRVGLFNAIWWWAAKFLMEPTIRSYQTFLSSQLKN